MQINPYLNFSGQCEEAFKFYERCLGAKITMLVKNGDSPMKEQTPPERHHYVLHASLMVGDAVLMGSDAPPEMYKPAQGFSVSLSVTSPAEAERIFKELSAGGQVMMPIQKTFWAERFGSVTDRFGTPWMISGGEQKP